MEVPSWMSAMSHIDQIEAHMDAGGKVDATNVRDLIKIIRDLTESLADAQLSISEFLRDQKERHNATV